MSMDTLIDDGNDDSEDEPEISGEINEEENEEDDANWLRPDGTVTAEGEQEIHNLAEKDWTQTKIADKIGISQSTVSERLKRPRYHNTNPCLEALEQNSDNEEDDDNTMSSQTDTSFEEVEMPTDHGEIEEDNANPLVDAIQNLGANKDGSMSAKALRAINEARDKPQFYMNNRQAFYQMLRGAGFESNNAEAITQAADANFQEQGPGFTYGGQSNEEDAFDQDPMDKMMDEMMQMMRFQQMQMMMESMSSGMGASNTQEKELPDPQELIAWKTVGDAFGANQEEQQNGHGDVKMARIPGPDGEFKQVPVQSTESLMPMMMMSMMGGGDSSSMGPEEVVKLVETLKDSDSTNDEMMRELLNELRERDKQMMDEKFERIEERVAGEEKSGLDFLDTIQEYEGVLGPMFGQGQNKDWEGKKQMMELQLENMDKFVDQRLRMLEKLNEMEKQTEMADAFSSITSEGMGGLAQGLGQMFGESMLNGNGAGGNGTSPMNNMMGNMADRQSSTDSPSSPGTPSQAAAQQAAQKAAQQAAQDTQIDATRERTGEQVHAQQRSNNTDQSSNSEQLKQLSPQVIDELAEEGEIEHLENLQDRIEQHKNKQEAS